MSNTVEQPAYLSIFTPSQTNPEHLEAIFVQREVLLSDAIERVEASGNSKNKHHQLIVGPRGAGKTHFVSLLVHRLTRSMPENSRLKIAWLNEDETCVVFLDLLRTIYKALNKRYAKEYPLEALDEIYEKAPNLAEQHLAEIIANELKKTDTTCLLIIENLDALFESISTKGQKKLRAYLQENPYFTLFATAQKLTADLKNRNDPFFGFFQTEHLKVLSENEAVQLIGKIATLNQKQEVSEFLKTAKGKARIAALHHLSGGNHRIYIVLSQFVSRDSIDALVMPFLKMVDELTPYYQERLRWLPPAQRKVIELLCTSRTTLSVSQIAKQLFSTNQSISSQLKDLRNKGYVNSHKRGRESLYEITEPLMRICIEVKENQSNRPFAILVDFIRAWYDVNDIQERLKNPKLSKLGLSYLQAAYKKNIVSMAGSLDAGVAQASDDADTQRQTISRLTALINQVDAPVDQVAEALLDRGFTYAKKDEHEKAIVDCSQLIALSDAPTDLVISALLIQGMAYAEQGESEKAIADYTELIALSDTPVDQVAIALLNRGVTYQLRDESEKALNDFDVINNLSDLENNEPKIRAHAFAAEIHIENNHWSIAKLSLIKSLELESTDTSLNSFNCHDIAYTLFKTSLNIDTRNKRVSELVDLYKNNNNALAALGAGIVAHVGSLNTTDPAPLSDNLSSWLKAWAQATQDIDELNVSMRIFTKGIAYLQSETKDESILLDLIDSERRILKQALQLE